MINLNFYKYNNKYLVSPFEIIDKSVIPVKEDKVTSFEGFIYYACNLPLSKNKTLSLITHVSQLNKSEDISMINETLNSTTHHLPKWLEKKIYAKKLFALNINSSNWKSAINHSFNDKWKVHVVGLGDVGGTLLSGLKLLGTNCIEKIGLYDLDKDKLLRWYYEIGQILSPSNLENSIEISIVEESDLFDCDLFVFCVSVGIPKIGEENETDVRMAQLAGNSKVVNFYAKMAREHNFKGTFAVVSDPVDQLCLSAFNSSNTTEDGILDYCGLSPEQIKGFGLGVMNARATFFANQREETRDYASSGRAFGPHGEGLIIVNNIFNYNEDLSNYLTNEAKTANLKVREVGYKPYVAPALSSGALSLIAYMEGSWHYSSNFLGGKYLGIRNRRVENTCEIETYNLPDVLFEKIRKTFSTL